MNSYLPPAVEPLLRPRWNRRRWFRWLVTVVAGYLILWGSTWLFAPGAVNRKFASHFSTTTDRNGNQVAVDLRTDSEFTGEGFSYGPDPAPSRTPWCCVGSPRVPAPFLVTTEFAFVTGPLSAGAGRVVFIWTPWDVYTVRQEWLWIA